MAGGKTGEWFTTITGNPEDGSFELTFYHGRKTIPWESWPTIVENVKKTHGKDSPRLKMLRDVFYGLAKRNIKAPVVVSLAGPVFSIEGVPIPGKNTVRMVPHFKGSTVESLADAGKLTERVIAALSKGTIADGGSIYGLKGDTFAARYGPCFTERKMALKKCSVAILDPIPGLPGAFNSSEGSALYDKLTERWKPYAPDTSKAVIAASSESEPRSVEERTMAMFDADESDAVEASDAATASADETAETVAAHVAPVVEPAK
jgi:hypothetical protein